MIRTPDSKIREAILFPVEYVRRMATAYFSHAHAADETIMPLVIQAVEQYGRNEAFRLLRHAEEMPQTPATIEWICTELDKEWHVDDMNIDNYCVSLALILCRAPVELLDIDMADLRSFPRELAEHFADRLEFAPWDWDPLWQALVELAEDTGANSYRVTREQSRREAELVEALARHADKRDTVVAMFERLERDDELAILEPYLLDIAGMMRISAAIPFLLKRLDDEDPFVSQCAQEGLEQIGGDEVVDQIALAWPAADSTFRVSASEVLESIHTDRSAEVCLRFFADEVDGDVQELLAGALLGGMVPDAVGPIRELIRGEKTGAARFFKAQLVAASTIMGVSFPEYDEWHREAAAADWYDEPIDHRLRDDFVEGEEGFEGFDDLFGDDEGDDEDFEGRDVEGWVADLEEIREQFASWVGPARSRKTAGRNDPCPCGSGKKYKKCCLKKESPPPEKPATEKDLFPVGTIALYGPNDRRTTKIAASVIRFPGAEPLLKRWVATNVTDSPRVRQEILDFLRQHGVKSVVASDGNLGCPHEEGLDFPEGGDCPFCPFWKGKQGSGATDPYW